MELGEQKQLTVTILPANADQSVTWTSNSRYEVPVSSTGMVTMKGKPVNPVTITATTSNGLTASIKVTYKEPDVIYNIEDDALLEEWYTIDGRKLNVRPTKHGIYILNGRKVVIR